MSVFGAREWTQRPARLMTEQHPGCSLTLLPRPRIPHITCEAFLPLRFTFRNIETACPHSASLSLPLRTEGQQHPVQWSDSPGCTSRQHCSPGGPETGWNQQGKAPGEPHHLPQLALPARLLTHERCSGTDKQMWLQHWEVTIVGFHLGNCFVFFIVKSPRLESNTKTSS